MGGLDGLPASCAGFSGWLPRPALKVHGFGFRGRFARKSPFLRRERQRILLGG
jgi:hypothetical protein